MTGTKMSFQIFAVLELREVAPPPAGREEACERTGEADSARQQLR
jgi:hypothetical protein